jgi:catechol 2,3-dioxygenase-like lactoylglutathione lyase family enzyme
MVTGAFADLSVRDVARSVEFYVELLGLDVVVDHGWYVELGVGERVVLALVVSGHETVPRHADGPARGLLVSFEVDDAAAVADRCVALGCRVVAPLTDELGQRHVMVADPDGTIVDVIERIPLTAGDVRRLAQLRRAHRARSC